MGFHQSLVPKIMQPSETMDDKEVLVISSSDDKEVLVISSSDDKEALVISSSDEKETRLSNIRCKQEDGTPLKPYICVKKKMDIKRFEQVDDCFILNFNPFDSMDIAKLTINYTDDHDDDFSVIAEKGQVACRDYPHSRHLCLRFPFDKTPHEKHCDLCYCYVCDSPAPCESWMTDCHCNASEHVGNWTSLRNLRKLKIRP